MQQRYFYSYCQVNVGNLPSYKFLLKMFLSIWSHLFHDPIDMGTPVPSGHLFLGGISLYSLRLSAAKILPEGTTPCK